MPTTASRQRPVSVKASRKRPGQFPIGANAVKEQQRRTHAGVALNRHHRLLIADPHDAQFNAVRSTTRRIP